MVNLLLPELEGIAKAIVSPCLIPLNTLDKILNGIDNPFVNVLSPLTKKPVKSSFKTDLLNFSVAVTCSTAPSTSSTDIASYNS